MLYLSFTTSAVDAIQLLKHHLSSIMDWTRANKLKLNHKKIDILLLEESPAKLVDNLSSLDGVALHLKYWVCNLGIILDPARFLEHQISAKFQFKANKSTFFHLKQSAQLHPYLPKKFLKVLIHPLIISKINYFITLHRASLTEARTSPEHGNQVNLWG